MSISTTSGSVRRTTSTASRPSPADPDHLAAAGLEHELEAGADQLLVVGHHDPGHVAPSTVSGMSTSTTKPASDVRAAA